MYHFQNFYESSYDCPKCRSTLFKSVFHKVGNIYANDKKTKIPFVRLFACETCRVILIPRPGFELRFNNFYVLQCIFSSQFNSYMKVLNAHGSKKGRRNDPMVQVEMFNPPTIEPLSMPAVHEVIDAYNYGNLKNFERSLNASPSSLPVQVEIEFEDSIPSDTSGIEQSQSSATEFGELLRNKLDIKAQRKNDFNKANRKKKNRAVSTTNAKKEEWPKNSPRLIKKAESEPTIQNKSCPYCNKAIDGEGELFFGETICEACYRKKYSKVVAKGEQDKRKKEQQKVSGFVNLFVWLFVIGAIVVVIIGLFYGVIFLGLAGSLR